MSPEVRTGVSLAPLTTFHLGGAAQFFVSATSIDELKEALAFAREHAVPIFILGGGSNVLIEDEGFAGLVIKIELGGIEESQENGRVILTAGAGESWDALVAHAVKEGFWGIENLSGIPGTVGGAVVQDIGAYGAALSQVLQWAEVFDTTTSEVKKLSVEECEFGYRDSVFKRAKGRHVVLRAALGLSRIAGPNLSYTDPSRLYKDLARRFAGTAPSLLELRTGILEIRREKFPDLAVLGTAGSFFKNPILSAEEAQRLRTQYPDLPLFPLPESKGMKVPLGWFLDYRHGVMDLRELRIGGARMYEKHFLVIVAERGTSSHDVQMLADEVERRVREATGLEIEREVETFSMQKLSTRQG
jgi:UDP-N-acetylmuramate dehydrogenase